MNFTSGELARHGIDLVVMSLGLALLVYAIAKPKVLRSLFPSAGRWMLVSGTAIFVIAHWMNIMLHSAPAGSLGVDVHAYLSQILPGWLFWFLTRSALLLIMGGLLTFIWSRKKLERVVSTTRHMIRDAQDNIVQSEARFRHLFETTSNSIFCYVFDPPMPVALPIEEQIRRSHDAVLTECNAVFARALHEDKPSAVIGSRMGVLDANKDPTAHHEFFKSFVESDYRLTDYELVYKTPDGDDRAVRSSLTGIVKDGLLYRFWGAETNITDFRTAKAALRRRRQHQQLVAEISSLLVKAPVTEADKVVKQCMVRLCRYAKTDRTALIWYDKTSLDVELMHSYMADGQQYNAPISLSTFPTCTVKLMQNEVVRINDTASLPAQFAVDRERFAERGIKSFVALPLEVDNEVVGVSTYTNAVHAREWLDQDVSDLQVFGELLTSFILRVRSRRQLDEALHGLKRATERLEAENVYLRQEVDRTQGFDEIIGQSDAVLRCLHMVEQVADTTTPVLILGETGTGKELVARAIHEHSSRKGRPLVKVNCAALPANLIESELFGYEKGAFTGAESAKRGRFDLANGSTLFLDEIGDIPLELQPKLLRALQEGEIERLGGNDPIKVDVRIIAATNRNLAEAVRTGEFRSDLFYRINTFPIEMPPLRDRGEDIQLLAEYFVEVHSKSLGREVSAISAEMMRQLREYAWPGNVRELDGVIQRALISSSDPVLQLADPLDAAKIPSAPEKTRVVSTTIADLRVVERDHILAVLDEADWKISGDSGAAARLGLPPSTLRSRMKKLDIQRPH